MGNFFNYYRSPVNYNHPGTYRTSADETGFIRATCINDNNVSAPAIIKVKIPRGEIVTVGEEMEYDDFGPQYANYWPTGKVSGICWTNEYLVESITPIDKSTEQCKFCYPRGNKYFIFEAGKNIRKPVKHNPQDVPHEACFFCIKLETAMDHKFYL